MRFTKLHTLSIAVITLFSSNLFAEPLEIAGSTTVKSEILDGNIATIRSGTGLDIKASGNGSGKGLIDLIDGKVRVTASSESLEDTVASAQKNAESGGKKFTAPAGLQFHQLKQDTLVIIVNKDNRVEELSQKQLKDIFTGKVKNWSEVGGVNMPIKVVLSEPGGGTRSVFQKKIMNDEAYIAGATETKNSRAVLFELAKTKEAISFVGEDIYWRTPGAAKVVKSPAVSRPLGLITLGKPAADVQKLLDFFNSEAGKKILTP